ncbi:MAG: DNA-binding transcriptional ArsR family regulator [Granulosicoccus sp.]|jgi:DNA-binding transcriptional ArsR family regulator
MDIKDIAANAQVAATLLKQLSNEHRLLILCLLMENELSVGQIHKQTSLSQSALSQHLASLRVAGLVKTRRESQTIYYSLDGEESIAIIEVLHKIYC